MGPRRYGAGKGVEINADAKAGCQKAPKQTPQGDITSSPLLCVNKVRIAYQHGSV